MTTNQPNLIKFNVPNLVGTEIKAIEQALVNNTLQGDGVFTKSCQDWFTKKLSCASALMTPSCTLGLELATLISEFKIGDEVLVPDFTFVTTAQSIALRGATPVLCDIRSDTLNIDESRLEEALTTKTKAIMPVHYAGISAEMDTINSFAKQHNLLVIEDAAQAIGCSYKQQPLGSMSDMAAFSFHATKNIQCGEGGMLAINNADYVDPAIIAWEKGTDRRKFTEGRVEKYQWQALGSSFLASEISAAMLSVQLDNEAVTNQTRLEIWNRYYEAFAVAEQRGVVTRPGLPKHIQHNGHLFYLILPDINVRKRMMIFLKEQGIETTFHYTPLHQSEGGKKYCKSGMTLDNAASLPHRLLRLPLYPGLQISEQEKIIECANQFLVTL